MLNSFQVVGWELRPTGGSGLIAPMQIAALE